MAVIGVRKDWRVEVEVSWMVIEVGAKSGKCSAIEYFHLFIMLPKFGRREQVVQIEDLSEVREELPSGLTSVVGDQMNRWSLWKYPVVD